MPRSLKIVALEFWTTAFPKIPQEPQAYNKFMEGLQWIPIASKVSRKNIQNQGGAKQRQLPIF